MVRCGFLAKVGGFQIGCAHLCELGLWLFTHALVTNSIHNYPSLISRLKSIWLMESTGAFTLGAISADGARQTEVIRLEILEHLFPSFPLPGIHVE